MPVAAIIAWAIVALAGGLAIRLAGHTIEKVTEDVQEVTHDVAETTKTALRPEVLLLLVAGVALVTGAFKFRK